MDPALHCVAVCSEKIASNEPSESDKQRRAIMYVSNILYAMPVWLVKILHLWRSEVRVHPI